MGGPPFTALNINGATWPLISMHLLQRILYLWKRFTPLEERLLGAVRTVLTGEASRIFNSQIAAVKHVQRLPPNWNEISFYPTKWWRKVDWSRVPSFPNKSEFRLAEVRFKVSNQSYKATLSCIDGHIFDFAIIPGPKNVGFSEWDEVPKVALLGDPLSTDSDIGREAPALPAKWRRLLSQQRGRLSSGWMLHAEGAVNQVTMDEGEFLVLAEREGNEFILYRTEPPSQELFYMESDDDTPKPISGSLEDMLGIGSTSQRRPSKRP